MSTSRSFVAVATRIGTFFSLQDVAGAAKVAVLGSTVNEMLFGKDADSIGQSFGFAITRSSDRVMASKARGWAKDMDDQILGPIRRCREAVGFQTFQSITVWLPRPARQAGSPTGSRFCCAPVIKSCLARATIS